MHSRPARCMYLVSEETQSLVPPSARLPRHRPLAGAEPVERRYALVRSWPRVQSWHVPLPLPMATAGVSPARFCVFLRCRPRHRPQVERAPPLRFRAYWRSQVSITRAVPPVMSSQCLGLMQKPDGQCRRETHEHGTMYTIAVLASAARHDHAWAQAIQGPGGVRRWLRPGGGRTPGIRLHFRASDLGPQATSVLLAPGPREVGHRRRGETAEERVV